MMPEEEEGTGDSEPSSTWELAEQQHHEIAAELGVSPGPATARRPHTPPNRRPRSFHGPYQQHQYVSPHHRQGHSRSSSLTSPTLPSPINIHHLGIGPPSPLFPLARQFSTPLMRSPPRGLERTPYSTLGYADDELSEEEEVEEREDGIDDEERYGGDHPGFDGSDERQQQSHRQDDGQYYELDEHQHQHQDGDDEENYETDAHRQQYHDRQHHAAETYDEHEPEQEPEGERPEEDPELNELSGLTQDSRDVLLDRLSDLMERLSRPTPGGRVAGLLHEAEMISELHAKVDEMEELLAGGSIAGTQEQPMQEGSEHGSWQDEGEQPEETLPAPHQLQNVSATKSVCAECEKTKAQKRQNDEAVERVMEEAEQLNAELVAVLERLEQRREESDHLHEIMVDRAEAAAARILELEKEVADLEEELASNESELKHLRLQLRAVETLYHDSAPPTGGDPDLVESIENWKADWARLREKMSTQRTPRRSRPDKEGTPPEKDTTVTSMTTQTGFPNPHYQTPTNNRFQTPTNNRFQRPSRPPKSKDGRHENAVS